VHDDLAGFVECLAQREAVAGAQAGGSRLSG
jgi:hypothetical protein